MVVSLGGGFCVGVLRICRADIATRVAHPLLNVLLLPEIYAVLHLKLLDRVALGAHRLEVSGPMLGQSIALVFLLLCLCRLCRACTHTHAITAKQHISYSSVGKENNTANRFSFFRLMVVMFFSSYDRLG